MSEEETVASPVVDEIPDIANFDQAEEVEDTPLVSSDAANIIPAYNSEGWHEYVMRQFKDDELVNGAPTCDGCRRVVEQLVGPIVESRIVELFPPTTANNGTATVAISIVVYVQNESHPHHDNTVVVEDVADVNAANTDNPYRKHPSATAATRAEGRALRKLLRLHNVYTAEEMSKAVEEESDVEWTPDEPITDAQINVIDMMCGTGRLDINVMQFVNSGARVYTNINEVKYTTAQRIIQALNQIQRNTRTKPAGVGSYIPNWHKR